MKIAGLHHVTAIAGDPQRNLDFYAGLLGLRLVKRTINFDDPGSYHLYYGDESGSPGTILTFFPWPGLPRGAHGSGEVEATALAIPEGSAQAWRRRLDGAHIPHTTTTCLGEEVIRFTDPDGLPLALVGSAPEQSEAKILGLHSVSAALTQVEGTAKLLTEVFGYEQTAQAGTRTRYTAPGAAGIGQSIDLISAPERGRGRSGAGSVHHIAFRVRDATEQVEWREKLVRLGYPVSPVRDRTYFESIYFHSPGGVLFEIATDAPGFAIDEPIAELGQHLRLPSWLENTREIIESKLPALRLPAQV